jgi:hypothetical protein
MVGKIDLRMLRENGWKFNFLQDKKHNRYVYSAVLTRAEDENRLLVQLVGDGESRREALVSVMGMAHKLRVSLD